jgi:molybdenum cofactor cytidylyltransferase
VPAIGVILAAGRSSRANAPKALFELDNDTLIERAVGTLLRGGTGEVCVVVGPPHAEQIRAQVTGVTWLENPDPTRGMFSSVQVAAEYALSLPECSGMVLSLLDHPRVQPGSVRALLEAEGKHADAARPVHAGQYGHPIYLSRGALKTIGKAPAGERLSHLIRELPVLLDVEVDDPGVLDDLDTAIELLQAGAKLPD